MRLVLGVMEENLRVWSSPIAIVPKPLLYNVRSVDYTASQEVESAKPVVQ